MEEEKTASNEIRKLVFIICSRQKGFLQARALALQPELQVSRDSGTLEKPARVQAGESGFQHHLPRYP